MRNQHLEICQRDFGNSVRITGTAGEGILAHQRVAFLHRTDSQRDLGEKLRYIADLLDPQVVESDPQTPTSYPKETHSDGQAVRDRRDPRSAEDTRPGPGAAQAAFAEHVEAGAVFIPAKAEPSPEVDCSGSVHAICNQRGEGANGGVRGVGGDGDGLRRAALIGEDGDVGSRLAEDAADCAVHNFEVDGYEATFDRLDDLPPDELSHELQSVLLLDIWRRLRRSGL